MSWLRKLLLLGALASAGFAAWLAFEPLPLALLPGRHALLVLDARGQVLREPTFQDGTRARWLPLDEVPKAALNALIASEDHRYGMHPGVDPVGVVRALWLDARAGRVVSGGSTLAMQLARLVYEIPRTFLGKLEQALRGIQLQLRLGERGVLEAYVNFAPFGRDVRGLSTASWAYLGKPLRDLTSGEAVALVCLVRAPSSYDPHRHHARLLQRRHHVLALMEARGLLTPRARDEADAETLQLVPFGRVFRAPHAADLALEEASRRGARLPTRLETTLDSQLQTLAQRACREAVASLAESAANDCAAVVQRISTSEILALVGSPDFRSPHAGQVNASLARRQPGSALKPFLYALAFERGRSPGETIRDEPTSFSAAFGRWIPANYDQRFHGEITLREALANSYNVPAAKLTLEVGVDALLERLRALGLRTLDENAAHYGVGLALGDGEVRLYDLVAAYAALARGGIYREPILLRKAAAGARELVLAETPERRVFSAPVSYLVSHVLQDRAARRAAFGAGSVLDLPFAASVKTGTSSDYRDNWTLGYAGDVVVGVWVGRHDGAPMHGVSGISGAGPAFRRIMLAAVGKGVPVFPPPPAELVLRPFGARVDLAAPNPAALARR